MTFSEQELHDIVDMVQKGTDIEIAKEKVVAEYKSDNFKKTYKIAEAVMRHFEVDTLIPKSRRTPEIMPMQVFAFLINDLIKGSLPKEVKQEFIKITTKDRTTLLHYARQYMFDYHLADHRYAHGDTFTNHFLSIKEKITGEKLDHLRVEPRKGDLNRGLSNLEIIYRDNKENIINDIDDITSYKELNNKYFFYSDITAFRKMFDLKFPEHKGKIRKNNRVAISKVIDEQKNSFMNCVDNGYTFKDLNDRYDLYSRPSDLKRMTLRYEPMIAKMILRNEESRVSYNK